jgi:3-phenylpropionate/trans-cinnamate dioxygenase ferredoxin reductase component
VPQPARPLGLWATFGRPADPYEWRRADHAPPRRNRPAARRTIDTPGTRRGGPALRSFKYVIVGGGQSGDAAVKGIRSVDEEGSILLIGAEPHDPYERPPLSKGLWMGSDSEDGLGLDTRDETVELWLGRRATAIDADAKTVTDSQGDVVGYERLLLATGCTARSLPGLPPSERVLAYRTLDDYHQARTLAKEGARVVVIGGGFIGSEMAAGLRTAGADVAMVFPEAHIGAGRFPEDLAAALDRDYRQRGVKLHAGRSVSRASSHPDRVQIALDDGTELSADLVVVGIGTEPNVTLARELGLEVDGGIHVDRFLRTGRPDIYACGDAMAFPHAALGRRVRVEHENNATASGHHAGRVMAGVEEPYEHVPFFFSDLFDSGYEAVGDLGGDLQAVADWKEPSDGPDRKGIVYYQDAERLRGVLLWNSFGKVDAATELLRRGERVDPAHPAL